MTQFRQTLFTVAVVVLTALGGGALMPGELAVANPIAAQGTAAIATGGQPTTTMAGTQMTTQRAGAQPANITFKNQTSNGTLMVVNSTVLPDGGFVVIHALNRSIVGPNLTPPENPNVNRPDRINNSIIGTQLGNSTYLESGQHTNVRILLNQSIWLSLINANQVFIADVHHDSNGNGQFDPQTDEVYVENGQRVLDLAFVNVTGVAAGADTTTATTEREKLPLCLHFV